MGKKLFLLTVLTFTLLPLYSQRVQESVSRKMNLAILNTLDEYESVASFAERRNEIDFIRLFTDPGRPCIYNDLMGMPLYQQMVSATQYTGLVPKAGGSMMDISLSNIEKDGEPYYEDGLIHRKISLTKNIMLIDASSYTGESGGVLFDSQLIYKSAPDFRMTFEFVYDESSGACKISSITSSPKTGSPVDDDRFTVLVTSNNKRDRSLVYEGRRVEFNDFGQAFVDYSKMDMKAVDVLVEKETIAESARYDVIKINYKPIRGRFKIKGSYMPKGAYSIESTYSGLSSSSWAAELTADLGYSIPASKIFKLGLFAGVGVSYSSISLNTDTLKYSYTHFSHDGVENRRDYSFTAQEGINCMDLVFPLYAECEFQVVDKLFICLDLGAKIYLNYKTKLTDYAVKGQFSGSSVDGIYSEFISPSVYSRDLIDISLAGSLSVEYGFSSTAFIMASAGYEYGMKPSYDGGRIYVDRDSGIYPFVYSENSKADVAFRSLVGTTTYTRRGLLVSLGFKFKF